MLAVFSGLTCPGVLSGWFIGHDPEMKKFSSGKLILLAIAEEAARRGTTRWNSAPPGRLQEPLRNFSYPVASGAVW